jgi:hypothetical protein
MAGEGARSGDEGGESGDEGAAAGGKGVVVQIGEGSGRAGYRKSKTVMVEGMRSLMEG